MQDHPFATTPELAPGSAPFSVLSSVSKTFRPFVLVPLLPSLLLHLDFDKRSPLFIVPMAPRKYGEAMAQTTEHCPEYYQQMEEDFNVLELTQRVYGKGSESMLSLVKNFWYQ